MSVAQLLCDAVYQENSYESTNLEMKTSKIQTRVTISARGTDDIIVFTIP